MAKLGLKLIHKGLILVLVPLAIQTSFFVYLKHQLELVEQEAKTQEVSKRALVKVNSTLLVSADWLEVLLTSKAEPERKIKQIYRTHQALLESLKNLNEYLKAEYDDKAEAQKIQRLTDNFVHQGEELTTSLLQNAGSDDLADILSSDNRFQKASTALKTELIHFALTQEEKTSKSFAIEQKNRESVNQLITTIVIVNILIAVLMMIFFLRGIATRLNLLSENAKRFSRGEKLIQQLKGNDEICLLDRVFHETADTVQQARHQEQQAIEISKLSERRLTNLIGNLPFALVTVSQDGKIENVNPTAERLLDCSATEIIGHRVNKILPMAHDATNARKVMPEMMEKTARAPLETEAVSLEGEYVPVEVTVTDFESESGRTFVATINDISERKRLELLKQNFLAMVSHDIRSPLASVGILLELVIDGHAQQLPESAKENLEKARHSLDRLQQMVTHLLDLEKLTSTEILLEQTQIVVSDFIQESVRNFEALAQAKQVTIEIDCPDASLEFIADSELLQRVIENFTSNAIKYSPHGGKVTLRAHKNADNLEVHVCDEGPGVPDHLRDEVFEKFKQVSQSDKKRGFGLGLAICKSIIEHHGGKIGVTPVQPHGSNFWFSIPLSS